MRATLVAWALCGLTVAVAHAQSSVSADAIERNNRGAALLKDGKTVEAVAEFRKAVELAPGHATARANLAYAYEQSGQLEEAMGAYRKLLDLEPKNVTARNNLATLYSRSGRHPFADSAALAEPV